MKSILTLALLGLALSANSQTVPKDSVTAKLRKIRSELLSLPTTSQHVKSEVKNCTLLINDALLRLTEYKGRYPSSYIDALNRLQRFAAALRQH